MTPSLLHAINSALKFIEKRLDSMSKNITGSLDSMKSVMLSSSLQQVKSLDTIGKRFEAAAEKMSAPEFDVAVDFAPLKADLMGIAADLKKIAGKTTPEVRNIEVLLKMILEAVSANKPEALAEKFDALDVVFKGLKPKDSVRFDESQMKGLMAAMTNRPMGAAGGTKSATDWQVNTVSLASANTEYTYTFPANTISWSLKLRGTTGILYYASASGKFPTSGDNTTYITVPASGTRSQDNVEYGGKTMYFQSDTVSQVVEIDVFTL
jgi:hypothetical protein